ncbi:uncharacterized protein LOC133520999 [Cydia pomonella]|uniref:uncharacterized protein LOC133520999 n=1 Tax=Cydia pomonella TaxID=82600 RepID=UPI002ADD8448|nr:uncharacterized protein LOC133520999 [Cydia pomonella]
MSLFSFPPESYSAVYDGKNEANFSHSFPYPFRSFHRYSCSQKDYLVPDNCRLLQAPKLNVEISAAVPDMVRNRDKNLATTQQQLGHGIAAVNRAMDILIKCVDANGIEAMKHLSNGCRILCDLHASSTQSRIKLITPSLDKTFLQVIQDTERDDTLFGNKLGEKIKAAKTIEKQGLQIKKTSPKKPTPAQPSTSRASYSGNWSAPRRYASNRGGRRGARRQTNYTRRTFPAPQAAKTSPATKTRAHAP